jgi:hypothetical protein
MNISRLIQSFTLGFSLLIILTACGASATPAEPAGAPYGIDRRPPPSGEDAEALLPAQVGGFMRGPVQGDIKNDDEVYTTYTSGEQEIFLTVSISDDVRGAQEGVKTAKEVLEHDKGSAFEQPLMSLATEPSYFKVSEGDIVFMAWQRGRYFFSADSQGSGEALDRFMQAFPY